MRSAERFALPAVLVVALVLRLWGIHSGLPWMSISLPYARRDGLAANELPDGTRDPNAAYPLGPDGSISAHHAGKANFCFCDGHAKAMKPSA